MDKLIIPPNPNWFVPSICYSTPDSGLIYGATSKIVFIPLNKTTTKDPDAKILDIRKKLNCFAINPEWNERQFVAVMNSECSVVIYNFTTGIATKGHRGHSVQIHKQVQYSSIVFTSESQVLSSSNSEVIQFCLSTNKYNIFPDFSSRNPITTMKVSTNHSGILAAGTKNGLILLIDYENMNILSKLRGHDMEITSLDFVIFSSPAAEVATAAAAAAAHNSNVDDIFDIYSYENAENEFGVYQEAIEDRSDYEESNQAELQEKVHNTSNFNFLEECSTLKDTILNNDSPNLNVSDAKQKYDDDREKYRSNNVQNPSIGFSNETNQSSHTPVLSEESLNYLEENKRMKDFVDVPTKDEETIVLVSGSRECAVWLWNVSDHKPMHKIKWHPKAKSALPSIFTNVLWINQETLLITDNNGDIIEYKIRFDDKAKSIKDVKQNKNIGCKGILSFCGTASNLWTISIHRNISCFSVESNQKVISLDTLQIRIHCLIENSIDSHVIAIGGNDKRLCLWNTSEANHHTITLKPFMNKIQSGVLALSWHPQKDNLIAFGTREGRIAILDTNRNTNVPIILESFTSHEIYSLAWAKFNENGSEVILLLACSGGKLVHYSQKDYKLHHLKNFSEINSISTSEKHLALGTNRGDLLICDMSCDFRVLMQKRLCKKYIGMISWHGAEKLAISTETGVTLIRDVDKFIATATTISSEIPDEILTTLSNQKGRVYSVRFNKAGDQIVACCMHGYVDIWNVDDGKLLASMNIETPAYTAMFLPTNENTVICGGQDSTVIAFEWKNHLISSPPPPHHQSMKRELAVDKFKSIEWATISELTTISKHSKRRVKKKVKENAKSGNLEEEVTKAMSTQLNLNTTKKSHSIFMASNRELTNNTLDLLEILLREDGERNRQELSLNQLMYGDRDDVKNAIDKESVKELPAKSIATIVLPQLTDDLKSDITERIASKSLMDIHVAVAPAVSYDLWRKCCLAYGIQLIENDDPIQALPYLLAVNDVDTCINKLCETKHYREAWVIAKLRKERDDPVFEKIMEKWIGYYDENGNYEIAATLLCMERKYNRAYDVLSKRQNMPSKCAEIMELLSTKLSKVTTTTTSSSLNNI